MPPRSSTQAPCTPKAVATIDRKAFLLRLSPELWKELERWAADDLRSINAQIEFLLRQAVQRRKGATKPKEE
jgi:hypothetical protein